MFLLSCLWASAPANRGHKRTPPIMLVAGPEKPKPEHERERPDGRTPIVALVFEFLRFVVSRACYAQILCRYSTIFFVWFSVLTRKDGWMAQNRRGVVPAERNADAVSVLLRSLANPRGDVRPRALRHIGKHQAEDPKNFRS